MKKVPRLTTDAETEAFLDKDLSTLDFAQFKAINWEARPKTARVNMRLPEGLIEAVKAKARREGISYQRLIREAIEREIARGEHPPSHPRHPPIVPPPPGAQSAQQPRSRPCPKPPPPFSPSPSPSPPRG